MFRYIGIDFFAAYESIYPTLLLQKKSCKKLSRDGFTLAFEVSALNSHAQVGRDFAKKLNKTNIPFSILDTSLPGSSAAIIPHEEIAFVNSIAQSKPNQQRIIYFSSTNVISSSKYSISETPFWEFEDGFYEGRKRFMHKGKSAVTFSDFCYEVISKAKGKNLRVCKMRYPFLIKEYKYDRNQVRSNYEIDKDSFAVFYNFNLGACADRKNPKGAIRAFTKAFNASDKAILVFKVSGASDVASLDEIVNEANDSGIREKLVIITKSLTHDDIMALTGSCDCYMSLHRGEGLGLGMLEAMSVHVPVIATAYGGNMEFCNDNTAFLVPYTLVTPNTDFPTYKGVTKWAEPDIDAAAKYLREIYDNREIGRVKADAAYNFVQDYYSLKNFEKDLRRLLEEW